MVIDARFNFGGRPVAQINPKVHHLLAAMLPSPLQSLCRRLAEATLQSYLGTLSDEFRQSAKGKILSCPKSRFRGGW